VRVAACIPGARDEALARSVTDTPHSKYLFMKVLETGAGGIISQCLEEQEGLGSVSVLGGLSLAPGNLVGIDPSQNLVRLAAPPPIQPFQSSSSLFIDYPDDSWQYTFSVPAGKLLIIECVSGSFTKKIGGSSDPSQPPFLFTVTTTAGGQTASHVVPVRGIFDYAGTQSWFQIAEPLRLYAAGGTSVTVKLLNFVSAGYQEQGSVSLAGQLQDTP